MISQTVPTIIPEHQEKLPIPEEAKDQAYISTYNESDYSDFLYLAPSLSAEFLPLEAKVADKATTLNIKKAGIRPTETRNTGSTPPPVTPAQGFEKEYFKATFSPSGQRTPIPENGQVAAEPRERRPSFVEDQHDIHKGENQKRHSHSSQDSEPMNWWPENEASASVELRQRQTDIKPPETLA